MPFNNLTEQLAIAKKIAVMTYLYGAKIHSAFIPSVLSNHKNTPICHILT